jgi:TM2 domain-containing membrane protein YozV
LPAAEAARSPDINTNARGCVTTTAALWALALLVITALLGVVIVLRARPEDAGLLGGVFCLTLGPLILLTIGAYVAARTREDQLAAEEDALRELARGRKRQE